MKKLDLSLTQVVGGALAAMTAAALGSRLGVAGTVIGAAVASVLAAVLGALYTASLRRTRETVRTAFRPRVSATATKPTPSRYPGVAAAVSPLVAPSAPIPRRRMRLWPRVLAGAVAAFALAGGVVTGFELLTGHALSGGTGTTIEKVGQAPRGTNSADDGSVQVEPSGTTTPSASTSVEPVPSTEPSQSTTTPSSAPSSTPSTDSSTDSSPAASSVTPDPSVPTTPPATGAASGAPAG